MPEEERVERIMKIIGIIVALGGIIWILTKIKLPKEGVGVPKVEIAELEVG